MSVLIAWLGEGGHPVSQELAEARANVCKHGNKADGYETDRCPMNVQPNWWGRVKSAAADTIKVHLEEKNKLSLVVSNESDLAMCQCCGCAMPLKVWVPTKHIAAHTTPELLESYPSFCWQKQEIMQHNNPP